jgi:hypothetical protein
MIVSQKCDLKKASWNLWTILLLSLVLKIYYGYMNIRFKFCPYLTRFSVGPLIRCAVTLQIRFVMACVVAATYSTSHCLRIVPLFPNATLVLSRSIVARAVTAIYNSLPAHLQICLCLICPFGADSLCLYVLEKSTFAEIQYFAFKASFSAQRNSFANTNKRPHNSTDEVKAKSAPGFANCLA